MSFKVENFKIYEAHVNTEAIVYSSGLDHKHISYGRCEGMLYGTSCFG